MKKRLFALLLAVVLVCSMLPTTVLATTAYSNTVDFSTLEDELETGNTIAVGTMITGLSGDLAIMYSSADSITGVHKTCADDSYTVEGNVASGDTTISEPKDGTWFVGYAKTATNADTGVTTHTLTLISTDADNSTDTVNLNFYTYDPNVLEITISTSPTNSWPTGMNMANYQWVEWALVDGTPVVESTASFTADTNIYGRWRDGDGNLYPAIYTSPLTLVIRLIPVPPVCPDVF